ncbi:hypothetical protein FCM35_KLT16533 [Carex littledalei]|uniref:Uncharacterized protein n=1 Tax=Carex littledalei TaxID=544730 RepID=A0A833RD01_9POAL|nr:hypothetical protein FCM35_KLT16533 [Carex littledalei]
MASLWCLSAATAAFSSSPVVKNPNGAVTVSPRNGFISLRSRPCALQRRRRDLTVCLVWDQEEDQQSYRHPLDFPYEVERPKPPGRTNVLPQFPAISTPLTTWLPHDVAPDDEIDEDEEEYEEEQEQEYQEEPDF